MVDIDEMTSPSAKGDTPRTEAMRKMQKMKNDNQNFFRLKPSPKRMTRKNQRREEN